MMSDDQIERYGQEKLALLKSNLRPLTEFFDRSRFVKPLGITEAGHRITRNSRYFGELLSTHFFPTRR